VGEVFGSLYYDVFEWECLKFILQAQCVAIACLASPWRQEGALLKWVKSAVYTHSYICTSSHREGSFDMHATCTRSDILLHTFMTVIHKIIHASIYRLSMRLWLCWCRYVRRRACYARGDSRCLSVLEYLALYDYFKSGRSSYFLVCIMKFCNFYVAVLFLLKIAFHSLVISRQRTWPFLCVRFFPN
jgi:hypothetical protein